MQPKPKPVAEPPVKRPDGYSSGIYAPASEKKL
jgi:hypothetical protein